MKKFLSMVLAAMIAASSATAYAVEVGPKCSVAMTSYDEITAESETELYSDDADSDDGFTKGTEEDSDYYWKLSESGTLTIKGTKMAEFYYTNVPWHDAYCAFSSSIKKVIIEPGMENIGTYAFYNCYQITSVSIPDSVKEIGWNAFYGCSNLLSVTIPANVSVIEDSTFCDCSNLVRVNINGNIEKIGDSAFAGCESLSQITLPDVIKSIGDYAFSGCSSLPTINLPDSITVIGNRAFEECHALKDILLPKKVEHIGSAAFQSCRSLTSISIPETIESISESLFSYCWRLADVQLPSGLIGIDDWAFAYCTDLTVIEIPENVLRIGAKAFRTDHGYNGFGLKVMVLKGNAPQIESDAFSSVNADIYYPVGDLTYTKDIKQDYNGTLNWTDEKAPDFEPFKWQLDDNGTLSISGSFMPNYYGYDNYCAFSSAWYASRNQIKNAVISDGVSNIGEYAFYDCSNMMSVTIPQSVTSIGRYAFSDTNLKDIYYPGSPLEWAQIKIDDSGNDALKGATIHYNYTGNEPDIPDLYTIDFAFNGVDMSIKWGGSLFEHSSSEYDNNLAIAACALSGLAENKKSAQPTKDLLLKMGFSESSMKSDHFNEWNPEKPAYVFANRDITVNGKTKKLVAVTIRGSQTFWGDWVFSDFRDGMYFGFSNSTAAVYNALQEYFAEEYLESVPKEDLIFFINGHSLGAAVAGRLTTKIVSNGLTPQDNIFAYTIAAPKYANWGKQEKFTNLFETINKYDVVPKLGGPGSSHYGVLDEFDPNQVTDFYKYWNKWENGTLKRGELFKNHDTTAYMSYLMTKDFFINDAITPWNDKSYLISVCCPVNVEIYDTDDNLLGRVVDNVVDESVENENVFIKIEGDEKYIFVESDKEIYVKLVGTDSGTMEYSVQNLKAVDEVTTEEDFVVYKDVTLEKGKEFYSAITEKDNAANVNLYVVDPETNQPTKTVEPDGTETDLNPEITIKIVIPVPGNDAPSTDDHKVEIKQNEVTIKTVNIAPNGKLKLDNISDGEYTFTFSAKNCAPRAYDVSVSNGTVNGLEDAVELHLYGDIDGDGKVNMKDVGKANAHAKNTAKLSGYDLSVSDINGDGKINMQDVGLMNAHAKNTKSLW